MNLTLIDKHRDINVSHYDWDGAVRETFRERMTEIGIYVDKIYFSGFWSQGDGACFEGSVWHWGKFLTHCGYPEDEHQALHQIARENWSVRAKHSGRYYHEMCTSFDIETINPDDELEDVFKAYYCPHESELKQTAWYAVLKGYDYEKLSEEFIAAFRDEMRGLYRTLGAKHDYLTSDEAVWGTIVANELDEEAA